MPRRCAGFCGGQYARRRAGLHQIQDDLREVVCSESCSFYIWARAARIWEGDAEISLRLGGCDAFSGAGSPLWNNGIKKYMRRVLRAKNKQSLPSSGIGRPRRRRHAGFTTAHMSEIAILGITSAIRIFEVRRLRVHPFSSGWAPGGAAGIPGEAVICAMALRYLHHALLILRILPNAISSPHPYGVFPDGGVLHNANIYQILRRRFGLDGVSGLRTAPFCVRKKCAIWRLSRFGICALPYIVSTQWRPGR